MGALSFRPPPTLLLPARARFSISSSKFTDGTFMQIYISTTTMTVVAKYSPDPSSGLEKENPSSSLSSASYMPSSGWPIRRFWPRASVMGNQETVMDDVPVKKIDPMERVVRSSRRRRRRGNWVMKILRVRTMWERERRAEEEDGDVDPMLEDGARCVRCCDEEGSEGCDVGGDDDDDETEVVIDREMFSRLLRRATLTEAKLYAKLSYLGCLAYSIPKIKTANLLKDHGLRFLTSSIEKKKVKIPNVNLEKPPVRNQPAKQEEKSKEPNIQTRNLISAIGAYLTVASAASYVQSRTTSILPFGNTKMEIETNTTGEETRDKNEESRAAHSDKASFVITTDSVTAVVAGKEKKKEAFSKELNSSRTSPCEWFICDDEISGTRYFIIQVLNFLEFYLTWNFGKKRLLPEHISMSFNAQGSESLASWQTNLLFEPIQFEGFNVLVHRGIYEAANGIYDQMLPEVRSHLKSRGETATLRFTGHSLGGSLCLLVNLMLLIRGEAPASSLLPVITYGAPSIMCGGNYLLQKLGLPLSHVQSITMHRDIVPRAFSCTYPNRVREILKAVNGNFRSHPCLKHQKLLYSPMGEMLILQPDDKFSPNHDLLPSGTGLYILNEPSESSHSRRLVHSALSVFMNSPHPLEILMDRSAFGSDRVVYRDHDMTSYLKSVQCVIRVEGKRLKKSKRSNRQKLWGPLLTTIVGNQDVNSLTGKRCKSKNIGPSRKNFSGIIQGGRESFKKLVRMVISRDTHVVIVLLLPVRMILFETLTITM